jgi:hypothetical protein
MKQEKKTKESEGERVIRHVCNYDCYFSPRIFPEIQYIDIHRVKSCLQMFLLNSGDRQRKRSKWGDR